MMHPLLEDETKAWLAQRGMPVPRGRAADTPDAAAAVAATMAGGAVIKALVPTGRRGHAGAVRIVDDPAGCHTATSGLLGSRIAGFTVERVQVEERIPIAEELYLSFTLIDERPEIRVSRHGGVDIEQVFRERPDSVLHHAVDPLHGLRTWDAAELWLRCGVTGPLIRDLARMTVSLYAAFRHADALTLEINPLAVTQADGLCLVGTMMAIDGDALFRHSCWRHIAGRRDGPGETGVRERRVQEANGAYPGGECQYLELDGDIGLLVGGGGAGLYLHDLIVEAGGRPANHCVTPPTGADTRKLQAVLEAILDNPRTRSLLVGFNFAQMARADTRVRTLVEVLRGRDIDTHRLPIVIRLFGPGEDEARALAAAFPGIRYLPRGATLRDAALAIVAATATARRGGRS
jgi:succinyl-CoA synthetase beta subunit